MPRRITFTADNITFLSPHERAKRLFLRYCTEKQKKQFAGTGVIDVVGKSGKTYWLDTSYSAIHNVTWHKNGKPIARYCAFPRNHSSLPKFDVHLAQMLALQTNDLKYRMIACSVNIDGTSRLPRPIAYFFIGIGGITVAFMAANLLFSLAALIWIYIHG